MTPKLVLCVAAFSGLPKFLYEYTFYSTLKLYIKPFHENFLFWYILKISEKYFQVVLRKTSEMKLVQVSDVLQIVVVESIFRKTLLSKFFPLVISPKNWKYSAIYNPVGTEYDLNVRKFFIWPSRWVLVIRKNYWLGKVNCMCNMTALSESIRFWK